MEMNCENYYALIAQLVERIHGKDEVSSSNLLEGSKTDMNFVTKLCVAGLPKFFTL